MACCLTQNVCVTVDGQTVWGVPGDVLLDAPDGKRELLHKIQYEEFMEQNGYVASGDRGFGWVLCTRIG
jgi:hypothetical protein